MTRIVIADDHASVREGLKRIVGEVPDLQVVGEAADGTEVMQRVRELEFDVLVLDLSMPGRSVAGSSRRNAARRGRTSGPETTPSSKISRALRSASIFDAPICLRSSFSAAR